MSSRRRLRTAVLLLGMAGALGACIGRALQPSSNPTPNLPFNTGSSAAGTSPIVIADDAGAITVHEHESGPDRDAALSPSARVADTSSSRSDDSASARTMGGSIQGKQTNSTFFCFSWVHGPAHSTDCYRNAKACEGARAEARSGASQTRERCETQTSASCTDVSNPPDAAPFERCFKDARACANYHSMVVGRGLKASPCMDR